MTSSDDFDHAIKLVDSTTAPNHERSNTEGSVTNLADPPRISTGGSIRTPVTRGGTLREEWTRRKYARYQESRYTDSAEASNDEQSGEADAKKTKKHTSVRHGRLRDRINFRSRKPKATKHAEEFVVDVLYENQRGSFFCGIPLYSSASLLNFDPSAWQTVSFKDSPVDITNAQVPDPTWAWVWKRWYVDMSHDVDEEGWEYSFSFNKNFSWHGTHPWLYSFVRRRRWLRKRVKIHRSEKAPLPGAGAPMSEAHHLNSEYFTIHAAPREASRGSSVDRMARSSLVGPVTGNNSEESSDDEDLEVDNIPALMKRLKHTTIDRKKLDSFKTFLDKGGDEVLLLPDIISDIMGLFMYQTSRRLALLDLQAAADSPKSPSNGQESSSGDKSAGKKPEPTSSQLKDPERSASGSPSPGGNKAKQKAALRAALDALPASVRDLEYWSDAKELADPIEGLDFTTRETMVVPQRLIGTRVKGEGEQQDAEETVGPTREDFGVGARIKGIPAAAGLDEEVGLVGRLGSGKKFKGKEREVCKEEHE